MSKRNLLILAALLPVVFFSLWVVLIEYHDYKLNGKVRVAVQGYDPRDLLSGHYLSLRPDWLRTDCRQFVNNRCPSAKFKSVYQLFVPEKHAERLDRLVRENWDNRLKMEVIFRYRRGSKPQLIDLWIDNLPWREWLEVKEAESARAGEGIEANQP